ncbi:MAG: PEP-CTERM sorting domain-containing protein [Verrucomicrobiaceae bacterium]
MKIRNKTTLPKLAVLLAAGTMSASGAVIAGWDSDWSTTTADQLVGATGVRADVSGTGLGINFRGSSDDGTFGSIAGADPSFGTAAADHKLGGRFSTTAAATVDFTVTDTSGLDRDLTTFSFDSVTRNGTQVGSFTLSVVSGGALTPGTVGTGNIAASFTANFLEDYDVSLTGLADNTLEANGSVTFRLAFVQSTAKHLELDNVAVSGVASVPEPSSALLLGLSGLALMARRRK